MFFRCLALAVLVLIGSIRLGGVGTSNPSASVPASANIPIASLTRGSYPANNWPGFTTSATTVSTTGGRQYINTTTSPSTNTLAMGAADWRDAEITFFMTRGRALLRGSQGGSGIYMNLGIDALGSLRIGAITGINYTTPTTGTKYATYIQDNPAACITNWPTTADHTFTFGVRGFEVYLLINGVQAYDTCQTTELNPTGAIRYYDYRPQTLEVGKVSIWDAGSTGGGIGNQITATYFPLTELYSNYATNTFDTRDFGMRSMPAMTGSMFAGSCTLTLNSPADIRINDKIIVEIGGESGAGLRNTIGVGGSSPELHYANAAARDADTGQPHKTFAYLDTDGSTAIYDSGTGTWQKTPGQSPFAAGGVFYAEVKVPVALRAGVIGVNGSPATALTLATFGADYNPTCAKAATTNANVYLNSRYSFYPMSTNPAAVFANRSDGLTAYQNMTMNVPAGIYYMGGRVDVHRTGNGDRTGLLLKGQGKRGITKFISPKGVPSALFEMNTANSNVTFQDFSYVGNRADHGYMWSYLAKTDKNGTPNKNFPDDPPVAISGGLSATNIKIQRIDCLNDFRGCAGLFGTGAQILNSDVVNTEPQRNYLQWGFMLVTSTGGVNKLENLTATSPWLYKAFNCFNTNGCIMNNLSGQNALLAVNGSSSTTVSNFSTVIKTDSFLNTYSGWLDEGVIQINNNNRGGGSGGTLSNFRIIQEGYAQLSSKRTIAGVKILGTQHTWNVTGQYSPATPACNTTAGGYIQIPNWDASSGASPGAMGVQATTANVTVSNIRVVGRAVGPPGLSRQYGNISLTGAGSSVSNSIADVIQPGPTLSNNRTNAAFCP